MVARRDLYTGPRYTFPGIAGWAALFPTSKTFPSEIVIQEVVSFPWKANLFEGAFFQAAFFEIAFFEAAFFEVTFFESLPR